MLSPSSLPLPSPNNREYSRVWPLTHPLAPTVPSPHLSQGFASIPLCFDVTTAMWFNEHFVTTDIPPPVDLETVLETGMWTWGWMEPPLGQLSFLLLCLEFARAQLDNIGVRPYNGHLMQKRAGRLQEKFPMYNDHILMDFSEELDVVSAQPEVKSRSDEWGDGRS